MADNVVQIIIKAVDQASSVIKNATSGMTKAYGSLNSIVKTATGLNIEQMASVAGVGMALKATVDFTKKAINETVEYNKTIREMTQVTGLGAEEISRIVQVGDDWGISIEAVRTSLAFMNKSGITPSIDNLAKLADEYVNAADKSAWAEKAVKVLGRGYQTLIPLLAQGGDKLRAQTTAIADNLVATEESIKAGREYEVAMDDLGDAFQGVKYTLGNELLPTVIKMVQGLNNLIDRSVEAENTENILRNAYEKGIITKKEYSEAMGALMTGQEDYTEALEKAQIAIDATNKLNEESNRIDELRATKYLPDTINATNELIEATDNAAMAIIDLTKAAFAKEAIDALNKALESGAITEDVYTVKMVEMMKMMGQTDDTIAATLAMEKLKDELANGTINAAQFADRARELYDNLNRLQGLRIEYEIIENKVTNMGPGGKRTGYQHGADFIIPPGYHENFPIGYGSSGERVIVVPNPTSQITNKTSINFPGTVINNSQDIEVLAARVAQVIQRRQG